MDPCAKVQQHLGAEDLKMDFPKWNVPQQGTLVLVCPCNLGTGSAAGFLQKEMNQVVLQVGGYCKL